MDIEDLARPSEYLAHGAEDLPFIAMRLINLSRANSSCQSWHGQPGRVAGSVGPGSNSPGRLRCPPFRRTYVRRN